MNTVINFIKSPNVLSILLLAILIRLLLMPFYFHPDIKTYHFQSSFLKTGVFNIYTYLQEHKQDLSLKEEFVYFPLTYLFLGSYQIIISPLLGGDFDSWLVDASSESVNKAGVFRYLFILKLPYLIFDLIIAFLIIKFFYSDLQKKTAFVLWLFNPFSLIIIYLFSNLDIIPVMLSLISLLLFKNQRLVLSGLILALAIGFKAYPILFLPFLLLHIKDFRKVILMSTVTIGTVMTIVAPFWSKAFLNSAFISGLTTRLVFPGISIGFGEALMVGVILLSILLFISLGANKNREDVWYYLLAVLLIVFSSIHFHIQWLLWIIPFLILFYIFHKSDGKLVWIWIFLASMIPLLYNDKSMTVSLLSAISSLYNLLPTPFLILQHFYDPFLTQGVIHSVIFGVSLILLWKILKIMKI